MTLKTLQLLKTNKVIKTYTILDFKQGKTFYYLKIKAILINSSILHIREYISDNERIYSYHWQSKNGKLICRWDNAPHYTWLKTFPHHKHISEKIEESQETDLEDILKKIENHLHPNQYHLITFLINSPLLMPFSCCHIFFE